MQSHQKFHKWHTHWLTIYMGQAKVTRNWEFLPVNLVLERITEHQSGAELQVEF